MPLHTLSLIVASLRNLTHEFDKIWAVITNFDSVYFNKVFGLMYEWFGEEEEKRSKISSLNETSPIFPNYIHLTWHKLRPSDSLKKEKWWRELSQRIYEFGDQIRNKIQSYKAWRVQTQNENNPLYFFPWWLFIYLFLGRDGDGGFGWWRVRALNPNLLC